MSTARMGHAAATKRSDPTRTKAAKAATLALKLARTTKHTSAPLDVDALAVELAR